jgi:hypothetical protein
VAACEFGLGVKAGGGRIQGDPVSSLRYVDGVPLWGDDDGWPRTPQEHAERDAFFTSRCYADTAARRIAS